MIGYLNMGLRGRSLLWLLLLASSAGLLPLAAPLPPHGTRTARVACSGHSGGSNRRLLQQDRGTPYSPDIRKPAVQDGVGVAATSLDFFLLLFEPNLREIRLAADLVLAEADADTAAKVAANAAADARAAAPPPAGSAVPDAVDLSAVLGRGSTARLLSNLTIVGMAGSETADVANGGTNAGQGVSRYTLLDFNFLNSKIQLGRGVTLRFQRVEIYKALNVGGQSPDFLSRSDGGTLLYDNVLVHRPVCVPLDLAVPQVLSLPPPREPEAAAAALERRVVFRNDTQLCWRRAAPNSALLCKASHLEFESFSTYVEARSGVLSDEGGYDVAYSDTRTVCDYAVTPECIAQRGPDFCLSQELLRWFGDAALPGDKPPTAGERDGRNASTLTIGLAAGLAGGLVLMLPVAVAAVILWRRRHPRHPSGASPRSSSDLPPAARPGGTAAAATNAADGSIGLHVCDPSGAAGSAAAGGGGGGGSAGGPAKRASNSGAPDTPDVGIDMAAPPLAVLRTATSAGTCGTGGTVGTGTGTGMGATPPGSGARPRQEMRVSGSGAGGGGTTPSFGAAEAADIEAIRRNLTLGGGRGSAEAPLNVQVLQLIGEGSFGKVYKGLWHGSTLVALKCLLLPGSLSQDARRRQMAVMEAAISSAMSHPNIVQTYTYSFRAITGTAAADIEGRSAGPSSTSAARQGGATPAPRVSGSGGANPSPSASIDAPRYHGYELLLVLEYCDRGSLRQAIDEGVFHRRARVAAAGVGSGPGPSDTRLGGGLAGAVRPHPGGSILAPPLVEGTSYASAAEGAAATTADGASGIGSGPCGIGSGGGGGFGSLQRIRAEERGAYNYGLMLQVAADVAAALLHLHSHGVVHGDIKAANVLLKSSFWGEGRRVGGASDASMTRSSPPPRLSAPGGGFGGGGGGGGGGGPEGSLPLTASGRPPSGRSAPSAAGTEAEGGGGLIAKVADFGLSTPLGLGDVEQTHVSAATAQGSLSHMAPELLLHGHISRRADVYAYGILLYELLSGGRAHAGVHRALLPHQVAIQGLRPSFPFYTPPDYRALAEACWDGAPTKRPDFSTILAQLNRMRQQFREEVAQAVVAAAVAATSAGESPAGGLAGLEEGWLPIPSFEATTCDSELYAAMLASSEAQ